MEEIFCTEGGKRQTARPEMVYAPSLETVQGEIGQGSKQPDLVKDVFLFIAGEFGQVDL